MINQDRDARRVGDLSVVEFKTMLDETLGRRPQADDLLPNLEAARLVHPGLPDATACNLWYHDRARHPEIDAMSIGTGRWRRWRRADLERVPPILAAKFAARKRAKQQTEAAKCTPSAAEATQGE